MYTNIQVLLSNRGRVDGKRVHVHKSGHGFPVRVLVGRPLGRGEGCGLRVGDDGRRQGVHLPALVFRGHVQTEELFWMRSKCVTNVIMNVSMFH